MQQVVMSLFAKVDKANATGWVFNIGKARQARNIVLFIVVQCIHLNFNTVYQFNG